MQQEERVRPKLATASELKGKKAGSGKKDPKKRRIALLIALVVLLACAIGGYFVVKALAPAVEEDTSDSTYTNTTIQMVTEDRVKNDLASLTVYWDGEEQYTIVSNLAKKAELTEAAQAETAAEVPEQTADAAALEAAAGVVENIVDAINVGNDVQEILGSAPSIEGTTEVTPEQLPDPEPIGAAAAEVTVKTTAEILAETPDYEIKDMPWFELNPSYANSMVTYSYTMIASRVIEENAEDLAAYGLDQPQVRIVYNYHDGTSMTINVGNRVAAGSYYYVTRDDSHDVYMVYQNVYSYNHYALNALHVMPTLDTIDPENDVIDRLYIAQAGKETIEAVYSESSDNTTTISVFRLKQPFTYDTNADRITEIETAIGSITLSGYAGYYQNEAEKAEYGLDEPFADIYVSDYYTGAVLQFTIGDIAKENSLFRYVTIDDSGKVYVMQDSLLGFLSNCRVSYLVDQFTNLVYIKRINGFEIATKDTTYTATIERENYTDENGDEQVNETYYYEGQFADKGIFKDFYQVVIGTLFDKRIEDESEYYFDGDVAVTITYHLTYTDEPYVVEYLDYDRDYYAIRKEGVSLFLIRKEKIQNMVDTAEAYRTGEYDGAHDTYEY